MLLFRKDINKGPFIKDVHTKSSKIDPSPHLARADTSRNQILHQKVRMSAPDPPSPHTHTHTHTLTADVFYGHLDSP